MAWRRSGDKPLSEPMMVRLPTHICVTRPQRVKQNNMAYGLDDVCSKQVENNELLRITNKSNLEHIMWVFDKQRSS